jgi:asparagine synthase (glutamine-hydrolysing)
MCGISGYIQSPNLGVDVSYLEAGNLLTHRGPDSFNYWKSEDSKFGLQHYRLSIIDLSDLGAQPMVSSDNRFILVFNGEIYNHLDIRLELKKVNKIISWKGHSDTETLIESISNWGLENTLQKIVGMFSFALYDTFDKSLYLVRDRTGEKPLYFSKYMNSLIFASEIQVFKGLNNKSNINVSALESLMNKGYITGKQSIFKNIEKVAPGTYVKFKINSNQNIESEEVIYWSWYKLKKANQNQSMDDCIKGLQSVLEKSVEQQMISDVSIGALLSGGIDSSLIVSLMSQKSTKKINTFTIGFDGAVSDEAPFAKSIANFLGTNHTEYYISEDQILKTIPKICEAYTEPFADSSQLPTLLVMQLAKNDVTVALSGDGGDELFGGYERYSQIQNFSIFNNSLPTLSRKVLSSLIRTLSIDTYNSIGKKVLKNEKFLGDKLYRVSNLIKLNNLFELNEKFTALWDTSELMIDYIPTNYAKSIIFPELTSSTILNNQERLMLYDSIQYLPDDLLVKVDRASMFFSLETRSPFLDHRVIEYSWGIPHRFKIENGKNKIILKELLSNYLPRELFERPKQGFGLPINNWLKLQLRPWAEDLLSETEISKSGFFNSSVVKNVWNQYLKGERNHQQRIWTYLMFQSWYNSIK